jgi:cytochrome c-type biogenesis protein CcmH/NrfG
MQFKEAAQSFEEAVRLDGSDVDTILALIQTLKDAGDNSRTESLARRAVSLSPENPKALVYLGEYLAFQSGTESARTEAIQLLTKAADLAPTMPLPHLALGRSLLDAHKYAQAEARLILAWDQLHKGERTLAQLESMSNVERRRAEAAYALAVATGALGKHSEADHWRLRFKQIDIRIEKRSRWSIGAFSNPPDVQSVENLARLDIATGGAVEASSLVARAIHFRPSDVRLRALSKQLERSPRDQ